MMALAFAVQALALLLLAAAMHATPPPWRLRERTKRRLAARIGGWLLLALSLDLALVAQRWDFAILSWIGLLTASAGFVIALLSWQRTRNRRRH